MADHSILSFQQWLAVQPGALDVKEQHKRYDEYVAIQKKAQQSDQVKAQQVADLKQKQMSDAKNGTSPTPTPAPNAPAAATTPGTLTPEMQSLLTSAGVDTQSLLAGAQGTMYIGTHVITQKSRSKNPDIAGHNLQIEDRRTKQSAYDDYLGWSVDQRNKFIAQGVKYGLLGQGAGFIEGQKLWQTLVDQAANYQRATPGIRMGPMDVLALMGKSGAGVSGPNAGTIKSENTTTSTTQYDRSATESMAKQVLQAALGRDPTPAEITRYQAAINANEKAHPTVTHSVSQVGPDGIARVSHSSSVSTATAPSQEILDQAQATPEYGSVQASTTYFNALERAMQAP